MDLNFDISAHTVYLAKHGSQAYGTNLPESDLDVKGFAVAPKSVVQGFLYEFEQLETKPDPNVVGSLDSTIYDLRKFCQLAARCNPNIIEVLFVDEGDILAISPSGRMIRESRDLFLSRKIRETFSGYAFAQLKRIKTHRKWLLDPPTVKPERENFGLRKVRITPDMLGAFDKVLSEEMGGEVPEIDPNVMQLVQSEKQYRSALQHWNQYLNWQKNRNEKRSELEAKFGYDTKHAGHLVRLLRMCGEILTGKGVLVKRPDAQELLGIRRGEWSYDQLMEWAEKQDQEVRNLVSSSTLPEEPDMENLNALCVAAHERFWADPYGMEFVRPGWNR